jgi:hypothetical protein
MKKNNNLVSLFVIVIIALSSCSEKKSSLDKLCSELKFENPKHGFISSKPASIWEESLISGNGTIGVLVPGDVNKDRIVLSHERIFLPRTPPLKGPDLGSILEDTRKLLLEGNYDGAAELFVKQSLKGGFTQEFVWTNPHIPACQLEFEALIPIETNTYARTVNYETGEAKVAFRDGEIIVHRDAFVSRDNNVAVIKFSSPSNAKLNYKFRLNELPLKKNDVEETEAEFRYNPKAFVESLDIAAENDLLSYSAEFKVKWKGSLEAYSTLVKIIPTNGSLKVNDEWIFVENADEILMLASIDLFFDSEMHSNDKLREKLNQVKADYNSLLEPHKKIHGEMFNRIGRIVGILKF